MERPAGRRDIHRVVRYPPSVSDSKVTCSVFSVHQIFFSDYFLDWTPSNLSLVDLDRQLKIPD